MLAESSSMINYPPVRTDIFHSAFWFYFSQRVLGFSFSNSMFCTIEDSAYVCKIKTAVVGVLIVESSQ